MIMFISVFLGAIAVLSRDSQTITVPEAWVVVDYIDPLND